MNVPNLILNVGKGTWAFMSIACLTDDDFKHRFQDDMESFYYVILYASVLWSPRDDVNDVEERMSKFFDEYVFYGRRTEGGTAKTLNVLRGTFLRMWDFKNGSLQQWLARVLELQRPFEIQPNWTAQALSDQWKITDEEDLPEDDRIDHLLMIQMEKDRLALLRSSGRSIDKLGRAGHSLDTPEKTSPPSSKRSAEDANVEERPDSSKRQCTFTPDRRRRHLSYMK